MQESYRYSQLEHHDKVLFWYSFLMGFPILLLFFNVSIYLFPFLIFAYNKRFGFVFNFNKIENWIAIYFGIGAILSIIDLYIRGEDIATKNLSLQVLLNYLYWVVLINFLISHSNHINFRIIAKGLFYGLVISTLYYFFLQDLGIRRIFLFKSLSQNAFAFLLIMFAPISIWYINTSSKVKSYIWSLLFVLCAFLSGSRSASILVLVGCTSVLLFKNFQYLFKALPFLFILFTSLYLLDFDGAIESLVEDLNPRTHALLYERDRVLSEDRSYLTRVAMVKKGLAIHEEYPLFGIGLNNFTNFEAEIEADFEGAKYVINKAGINETSSHNSYINILAETGLFGFIPFILLLIIPLVRILVNLAKINIMSIAFFSGYICMLTHLYFINAIVNVFAWYTIGISIAMIHSKSSKV